VITLDRTTVRMLGGVALVMAIAAALVFLYAVIHPSQADIEQAERALDQERRPAEQRDPNYAWPRTTRWDFTTHLPVPGTVNRYRWRAQGEFACSLDGDRDQMVNFRLDTPNAHEPIELTTPLAVFNKKARTLDSETDTRVTFAWGTVQSERMHLKLDTSNARFDENVTVMVERGRAIGDSGDDESGNEQGDDESGNEQDDDETEAEKEEVKSLRITADHFEIYSDEDKGVFTGNVVATDSSDAIEADNTIEADKMAVEYYTDEDREKADDPSLTGAKLITCTGNVWIDWSTDQAMCDKAVFDLQKNTITMEKTETAQVLYRKDDGEEKYQVLADRVVMDLNPGGKTIFSGKTETVQFSETTESFFGLRPKDEEPTNDDGAGTTDE
jgi:lipopolysaccharide export system protein LptA